MNILYQYYNEIVLFFDEYEIDLQEKVIIIDVPDSKKPFDSVCEKIDVQLNRIAGTLDPRDNDISIHIRRGEEVKEIVMLAHCS